jgi:manganese/iron transport system substrate-binding protein
MLTLGLVTAAAGQSTVEQPQRRIVCSTTQVADFARQVVGDRWQVVSILGPGADPHTFTVTPKATQMVKQADLCFDNGLHLEGGDWMRTVAEQLEKPIFSCTQGIQPLQIQIDGQQQTVADPHAWFDPANAVVYIRNIHQALSTADPDHAAEYTARAELYLDQLRVLELWIKRRVAAIPDQRRVLITSHDAFNYFCRAFGLRSSTPVGWSTQEVGAEVTPQRRQAVVQSIREAGVPAIFVETSVNPKLVRDIAKEAGVSIGGELYSDAMGTAGSAGETYLGMMRENVLTITQALRADKD